VSEAAALEAIQFARHESPKLQQPQIELARAMGKRKDKFLLSGADPPAHARVYDKGRGIVEGACFLLELILLSKFDERDLLPQKKSFKREGFCAFLLVPHCV
jgi:hypothetical protein